MLAPIEVGDGDGIRPGIADGDTRIRRSRAPEVGIAGRATSGHGAELLSFGRTDLRSRRINRACRLRMNRQLHAIAIHTTVGVCHFNAKVVNSGTARHVKRRIRRTRVA